MAAVDVAANVPLPTSPPLGQSVTTASLDRHISNSASEEPVSTPAAEPTENGTEGGSVNAEAPAHDATPATTEPVVSTDSEAAPAVTSEPAEATHDATKKWCFEIFCTTLCYVKTFY